jgi:hypothetical protein
MSQTKLALCLAGLSLMGLGACGRNPQPEVALPSSLTEVAVAEDFTFASTRTVGLTVDVAPGVLPVGQAGSLVLTNSEGRVLYRGPVLESGRVQVQLALPLSEQTVKASLASSAGTRAADVSIQQDAAQARFE